MLNLSNNRNQPLSRSGFGIWIFTILAIFAVSSQIAFADAPLKTKLGLDTDQAKIVSEIQKRYRAEKRSIRQLLNRESRKLRRAKLANNGAEVTELTGKIIDIQDNMRSAILSEDNEIRGVLSAEQQSTFDSHVKIRNEMVGSSRDVKAL